MRNNKGYLIVELVLASVLSMIIAYFLLSLVVKVSEKNKDLYLETSLLTDKALMTNVIMKDINQYVLLGMQDENDILLLNFADKNNINDTFTKSLKVEESSSGIYSFKYGLYENNNFIIDENYFEKKINKNLQPETSSPFDITSTGNLFNVSVNMNTLYSNKNYGLDFSIPYEPNNIIFPTIARKYSNNIVVFTTDAPTDIISYFNYEPANDVETSCFLEDGTTITSTQTLIERGVGDHTVTCKVESKNKLSSKADITFTVKPDEKNLTCSLINAKYETPDFSKIATTDEGVFMDSATGSCYYRGAVTNNYLRFAGLDWRIIRIDGNGDIHIILDDKMSMRVGTGKNSYTKTEFQYNEDDEWNTYVGFMLERNESAGLYALDFDVTHGNGGDDSIVKEYLTKWYEGRFKNNSYSSYISNKAVYCNDRASDEKTRDNSNCRARAYGTCYYPAYYRIVGVSHQSSGNSPSLSCDMPHDAFSWNNEKAKSIIGLITADEVVMAGGVWNKDNKDYYLYKGYIYWTMSPAYHWFYTSNVFLVSNGALSIEYRNGGYIGPGSTSSQAAGNINASYAVRPVISLKAELNFLGNGTKDKPYQIVE